MRHGFEHGLAHRHRAPALHAVFFAEARCLSQFDFRLLLKIGGCLDDARGIPGRHRPIRNVPGCNATGNYDRTWIHPRRIRDLVEFSQDPSA